MAGEVFIGRIKDSGLLVIGESDGNNGLKNAYMIQLIQNPQNAQRIAVQLRSPFWPMTNKSGDIKSDNLLTMVEIDEAQIIDEYVQMKTSGRLDLVTGSEANQVMNQLNQQAKKAKQKGIIK